MSDNIESNLASEITVLHKTFALEITDVKNVVVKKSKGNFFA